MSSQTLPVKEKPKMTLRQWVTMLLPIVVDLAVPTLLFYALRAAGVGQWWALVLGGLPAVVRIGWGIAKQRRLNGVALFTLSMMVLGNVVSLLTGDPRLLLAREAWMTALVGLWMLASLLARRPIIFTGAKLMMPNQETRDDWDESWNHPAFRHVMRAGTVIWAVLLFADTAVRIVMAYNLPVDAVPGLNIVSWIVLIALMQFSVRLYGKFYARRHNFKIDGAKVVSA
jgi:hypothetical protein